MKVCVIGCGFVGLVTAGVYASLGHEVMGLDVDEKRIAQLQAGKTPFFEPHLSELLFESSMAGSLTFTTSYKAGVDTAELVVVCVGTPSSESGAVNLEYVRDSLHQIALHLTKGAIVAIKSTVPPGSFSQFAEDLQVSQTQAKLVALPEFLREGTAVEDARHPQRVVIGTHDKEVFALLAQLHKPLEAHCVQVSPESAQMGKYAANAYLATRITYINQIADLCEHNGADISEVISVIGLDERIGEQYWYPGLGYGGSCFPKDVRELAYFSRQIGASDNWFNQMTQYNEERISQKIAALEQKVGVFSGKTIAVLGLAFKPFTDDTREAPANAVIPLLLAKKARVRAFDPKAHVLPELLSNKQLQQVASMQEACELADGIILLIEWPQIISFDFGSCQKAQEAWIFDTRNQLDPQTVVKWGYTYFGIGR